MKTELQKCADYKCGHIKQPWTIDQILQQIYTNEYSAELMLQHLLLWAANSGAKQQNP